MMAMCKTIIGSLLDSKSAVERMLFLRRLETYKFDSEVFKMVLGNIFRSKEDSKKKLS
jgi:hypothetical protein